MAPTNESKLISDYVISFTASVFLIYPAIKDILENNGRAAEALFFSLIFALFVITGTSILLKRLYNTR